MKHRRLILIALILVLLPVIALADKARFLKNDRNSSYHASHLILHVGSQNCRVSGNYITVRANPGSGGTLGHVEQSDAFRLEEVQGNYARITVTYSAPTSPASWSGLSGWVSADYVECPCSSGEYYSGSARRTYSLATASGSLSLRELPDTSARTLAKIPSGDSLEVLADYDGGWYRVRWGQRMGFVRSRDVQITATGIPESGSYAPVVPQDWRAAYRQLLEANHTALGSAAIYDMDRDGIPELVVHNGEDSMAGAFCLVYAWNGSSAVQIGEAGFRECTFFDYPGSAYPGLFCTDGNMGVYTTRRYMKLGYTVVTSDVAEEDHTHGGAVSWDDIPAYTYFTSDGGLISLLSGTPGTLLTMYSYTDITAMGWDAFFAAAR